MSYYYEDYLWKSPDGTPWMKSSHGNGHVNKTDFAKTCDSIKKTNLRYKRIDYKRAR